MHVFARKGGSLRGFPRLSSVCRSAVSRNWPRFMNSVAVRCWRFHIPSPLSSHHIVSLYLDHPKREARERSHLQHRCTHHRALSVSPTPRVYQAGAGGTSYTTHIAHPRSPPIEGSAMSLPSFPGGQHGSDGNGDSGSSYPSSSPTGGGEGILRGLPIGGSGDSLPLWLLACCGTFTAVG